MGHHALTIPLPDSVWEMLKPPPRTRYMNISEELLLNEGARIVLRMEPFMHLNNAQLYDFCQVNRDLRIEQNQEGELLIMSPTGGITSWRNSKIVARLLTWAEQQREGVVFDSSGGFLLSDGSMRAPEAAWVRRSRLAQLTSVQKQHFLPLCPDFVVELRSPSDSLKELQIKMEEYLDNGLQLGWLIDPPEEGVYIYRPGHEVECVDHPTSLSGDPVLPGFVFHIRDIWTPDF